MTSDDQPAGQSISLGTAGATVSDERIRLLLVDDEPNIRRMVISNLDPGKYSCIEAGSGLEALEILAKHEIDIAVVDVMMPDMGGFELLNQIWADSERSELPAVMLSHIAPDGSRSQQKQSFREYFHPHTIELVIKPFKFLELQLAINEVLETSR